MQGAGRITTNEVETVERVRAICLGLPEATERLSHGEPTWFVKGRTFVMYADHHHDDRLAIWCHAPDGFQRALVSAEPERFFVPPYVGRRGWIGVRLDVEVDWDEVATIIEGAYRMVAPRRLVEAVDARHDARPHERPQPPGSAPC
jgi:hypothetical protein